MRENNDVNNFSYIIKIDYGIGDSAENMKPRKKQLAELFSLDWKVWAIT